MVCPIASVARYTALEDGSSGGHGFDPHCEPLSPRANYHPNKWYAEMVGAPALIIDPTVEFGGNLVGFGATSVDHINVAGFGGVGKVAIASTDRTFAGTPVEARPRAHAPLVVARTVHNKLRSSTVGTVLVVARFYQVGLAETADVQLRFASGAVQLPVGAAHCTVAVDRVSAGLGDAARNATSPVQISITTVPVGAGGTLSVDLVAMHVRDAFKVVISACF